MFAVWDYKWEPPELQFEVLLMGLTTQPGTLSQLGLPTALRDFPALWNVNTCVSILVNSPLTEMAFHGVFSDKENKELL